MKKASLNKLLTNLRGVRKELEMTANRKLHFDRFHRAYEPLLPDEWVEGFDGIEIDGTKSLSRKGLCEHIASLKELEDVIKHVIDKTGRGRPRGTISKKCQELDAVVIRETRKLWKETDRPPGISTDTTTGEAYGELVNRVMKARGKDDKNLNPMKVRNSVRRLKKDPEIIASGLFTENYDNRRAGEIYARFLKKGKKLARK